MVDNAIVAGLAGVAFLASVYANHRRFRRDRQSVWHVLGAAAAALAVLYVFGEALPFSLGISLFGILDLSSGTVLLAAVAFPLAAAVLPDDHRRAPAE